METPIGVAVAMRDWVRERRGAEQGDSARSAQDAPSIESPSTEEVPFQRRVARRLMKATARIDPTRHLTALVGKAASLRGLFVRDEA